MMINSINLDLSPLGAFLRIPKKAHHLAYLASDGSDDARWSILAWDPSEITSKWSDKREEYNGELPFIGGYIGSINYEGESSFGRYENALVYDHHQSRWYKIGDPDLSWINNPIQFQSQTLSLKPTWDYERYSKAFQTVKDNIQRGEIYQACLTFPFTGHGVQDTRSLFSQLLEKNPAPMGMYLEQKNRSILSLSPERFLLLKGSTLETRPIKGTRPKGKTPEESLMSQLELLSDHKEAAELNMITDLLRNDMAKISKPGTVKVIEHQALQECPKVWHTYSHIESEIAERISPWLIVEAMFPGGSITGCPKIRAMEILREVEGYHRGIYTGCLGYLSHQGRMDMNIAIRTLEQREGKIFTGFGGGIVAESDCRREYEECLLKAQTFAL